MKKLLLATMLSLGTIFPAKAPLSKHNSNLEKILSKETYDKIPEIPKYKTSGENCSGYVRKAGYDLYHKNYSWTDAWNRTHAEKIIYKFQGDDYLLEIDSLRKNDDLQPGMIIGTHFKGSPRNWTEKDWHGKSPKYTHVLLYAGKDSTQTHYFMHEWGKKQELISYDELIKLGLKPIEILDENIQLIAKDENTKKTKDNLNQTLQ